MRIGNCAILDRLCSSGATWAAQNSDKLTNWLVCVIPCFAVLALVAREVTKYIAASLDFQFAAGLELKLSSIVFTYLEKCVKR